MKKYLKKFFKNNFKKPLQSGFTVVEMLLYMGLFSILLVVLFQIFTSILSVHAESQATSSVNQEGSYILSRLAYDIHRASSIAAPALGTQNSTLHITGDNIDETYSINSGNLLLTDNTTGNSDQINSVNTSITAAFTTLGESTTGSKQTVKINLTVTSKILRDGGKIQSQTYNTTIQTR